MKEHLYHAHTQPNYCPRCWAVFDTNINLIDHSRLAQCYISAPKPIEGIDHKTREALRKRSPALRLEEDKWRDVYHLLFPEVALVDILSPYSTSNCTTRDQSPGTKKYMQAHKAMPSLCKSDDSGYGGSPSVSLPMAKTSAEVGIVTAPWSTIAAPLAAHLSPSAPASELTETFTTPDSNNEISEAPVSPESINYELSEGPTGFDSIYDSKADETNKHTQERLHPREALYKSSELDPIAIVNAGATPKQSILDLAVLDLPGEQSPQRASTELHLEPSNVQDEDSNQECPYPTIVHESAKLESTDRNKDTNHHSTIEVPQKDRSSVVPNHIMQWVDSTKTTTVDPITPAGSQCVSLLSSGVESILETDQAYPHSTKAMVLEVMYLLLNQPCNLEIDDLNDNDGYCFEPNKDGSDSSQSGIRSTSAQSRASTT
jgi:hypothetical protein